MNPQVLRNGLCDGGGAMATPQRGAPARARLPVAVSRCQGRDSRPRWPGYGSRHEDCRCWLRSRDADSGAVRVLKDASVVYGSARTSRLPGRHRRGVRARDHGLPEPALAPRRGRLRPATRCLRARAAPGDIVPGSHRCRSRLQARLRSRGWRLSGLTGMTMTTPSPAPLKR